MRIAAFILAVVTIIAMIFYLTGNPLIATYHLLKLNYAGSSSVKAKRIILYCLFYVSVAVIWNIAAPGIICYNSQPAVYENHVLKRMPQYGEMYVKEYKRSENLLTDAAVRAYYMEQGDTMTRSTKKGVPVEYVSLENGTSVLEIRVREPKEKTGIYFFMDRITWAKKPRIEYYTFFINGKE